MLATNKKATLCFTNNKYYEYKNLPDGETYKGFELYFISDEEFNYPTEKNTPYYDGEGHIRFSGTGNCYSLSSKNIIASTDKSLGLPEPFPSFIEAYIKARNEDKPITKVMVDYEEIKNYGCADCGDPDTWSVNTGKFKLKVDKNNQITITEVKDSLKELCSKDPELRKEVKDKMLLAYNEGFKSSYSKKGINYSKKEINKFEWIEENL